MQGLAGALGGRQSSDQSLTELTDKTPLSLTLLRVLLAFLLAAAAGALGAASYLLFRMTEEDRFKAQFADSAVQIATALTNGLVDKASTSTAVAAFLGATGSRLGTFPNVTFPGFSQFAAAQLQLSQSRALSFNPLLTAAQLAPWTAYARASLPLLGAPAAVFGTINATAALGVYERNAANAVVASSASRPFTTPVWQIAPFVGNAAAVFYDLHSQIDRQLALDTCIATGAAAATAIITLVQDRAANISRASGIVFAPVFDAAAPNASAIVGFTSVVFSWDAFLASSLPAFITGIDAVLRSPANNATFTFHIVGGVPATVSAGDTHETTLEHMASVVLLDSSAVGGQMFTLSLYPTAALRNSYLTNNPQNACVGVVCIIVAVALVFRLYDLAVIYHSAELASKASISTRILDTVFPESVRNRLFRHHAAAGGGGSSAHGHGRSTPPAARDSTDSAPPGVSAFRAASTGASAAVKFMRTLAASKFSTPRPSATEMQSAPIADTFHDCTVLFADICQFTKWSAELDASRVFAVLEAVWGSFDEGARNRGVFKVETIGDCYLCVTGLPEPNGDHAAAMADFALELEGRLAAACAREGVAEGLLRLRVGLHSGSVTAGVLRADRSRFQLFGDTVNTASRMESTGEPGRIQVSAATMQLLRAGGRHELQYRGKVAAKGKGELDTYWLQPPMLARPTRRNSVSGLRGSGAASAAEQRV